MKTKLLLAFCLAFGGGLSAVRAQVVINEYSASNLNQFVDNHSDYEDWIELYNAGSSTVNVGGYHLSDDSLNTIKYTIPARQRLRRTDFCVSGVRGEIIMLRDIITRISILHRLKTAERISYSQIPQGISSKGSMR